MTNAWFLGSAFFSLHHCVNSKWAVDLANAKANSSQLGVYCELES